MKKKGYIAGSLFNEAEVSQRLLEGDCFENLPALKLIGLTQLNNLVMKNQNYQQQWTFS